MSIPQSTVLSPKVEQLSEHRIGMTCHSAPVGHKPCQGSRGVVGSIEFLKSHRSTTSSTSERAANQMEDWSILSFAQPWETTSIDDRELWPVTGVKKLETSLFSTPQFCRPPSWIPSPKWDTAHPDPKPVANTWLQSRIGTKAAFQKNPQKLFSLGFLLGTILVMKLRQEVSYFLFEW